MADEKEIVEVPKKFEKIVDEISKMSVLDLSELVKVLENKFGVSAQAPMMAMPTAVVAEAVEEKSSYDVVLTAPGAKKIEVIKVVRDLTQKGLKESKDLVDASEKEPQVVKEGAKKEEAEEIKKKFEAAGAKVELK
ncbi:MAG: 50S ribosomal protein L7/L12 [Candidatus Gribaldobacteria bacterium]|nr:50S ribosomal protein L7/L12 [Candidatus Gribaldobacteria bacterium]